MTEFLTVGQIRTIADLVQTWGLPPSGLVNIDPLVKGGVDNGAIIVTMPNRTSYTIQKSGKIL